ncbi:MAG: pseudouridine synthase, partial [Bacteroidota bacterium]
MAGIGSRRKNDELILTGVVSVNGRTVKELGFQVKPASDRVTINGKPVALAQKNVYILLNKPRDCITTLSDEKGRTTVIDYVRVRQRVYPVGRLDRNSTGVLILTNDGAFANRLTHPKYEIDKEYRVSLDKKISTEHLGLLRHKGVRLADGLARPKSVEVVKTSGRQQVVISIHEGKNREIRRMCE